MKEFIDDALREISRMDTTDYVLMVMVTCIILMVSFLFIIGFVVLFPYSLPIVIFIVLCVYIRLYATRNY